MTSDAAWFLPAKIKSNVTFFPVKLYLHGALLHKRKNETPRNLDAKKKA